MAKISELSDRWRRVWDLFHSALNLESAQRSAFLEQACGSDDDLRLEVEELLASHERGSSLLDQPVELAVDPVEGAALPTETLDRSSAESLSVGTVLAGRFEIVGFLGKGGMGAVYAARDRELGSTVALKVMRPEIAANPEARERFRREINLARQVTHPNVCRIYDLFHHDEQVLFLSMELLEGQTLAETLRREGPLGLSEAMSVVEQVAAALEAAHRAGIVHRDFKSANVMSVAGDEGIRVVVTDFGLARTTRIEGQSELQLTRTGQLLGTPAFMAPEQFEGGEITPATDVYALGVVIFQMVTGALPFTGDTPYSVAAQRLQRKAPSPRRYLPELDRRWEGVILRCLERDPVDRFESPSEVAEALRGERRARRFLPRRRNRLKVGVAAAVVLLLSVLLWPQLSRISETKLPIAADALGFAERNWVLISAFENRAGEDIFDGTLEYALRRELGNSRFVNVVPRERIADTLRLMRKPLDTTVDAALGREICLRDGEVRALLTGRVERLGSAYVLSAELVEPGQGLAVASFAEEAESQEQVLPAVRRLSSRIRETLGEELSLIQQSDEKLEKVTTPSLSALHLFSKALAIGRLRDDRAMEELLKQAVTEDPDFASAYSWLAVVIMHQGRPSEDYMPYAERALELADSTTVEERYRIRARYFETQGQPEDALASYEAIRQLHPDRFDAAAMMATLAFQLARFEDAVPYAVEWAKNLPNTFMGNMEAARALAIWANRPNEAKPYVERARELGSPEDYEYGRLLYFITWVKFYQAHELWLEGDLDGVLREIRQWSKELRSQRGELHDYAMESMGVFYLALGKIEAAEESFQLISDESRREGNLLEIALARNDEEGLRQALKRRAEAPDRAGEVTAVLLARSGLLSRARSVVASLRERAAGPPYYGGPGPRPARRRPLVPVVTIAQAELTLAEGHTEQAISLLRDSVGQLRPSGYAIYFLGAESLARAWEKQGEPNKALRVLEDASQQKNRTYPFSKLHWMRVRLRLAQLYHELGRDVEAAEIEAELRRLLVYADPDFWVLLQLQDSTDQAVVESPR